VSDNGTIYGMSAEWLAAHPVRLPSQPQPAWSIGANSAYPSNGRCFIERDARGWWVYATDAEGAVTSDLLWPSAIATLHEAIRCFQRVSL